jgi:PAS domain-containing protein
MDDSRGIPAAAHRVAAVWARSAASDQLGAAAARTEAGRRDLRSAQEELIGDVAALERISERTRRYAPAGVQPAGRGADTICPYKGLASFDAVDAEYYFGRDRLIAELVAKMVGNPFLGFVGASGSGKSSAIRAGLLPALAGGVLPGSDRWLQVLMRPGEHPMAALGQALARALPEAPAEGLDPTDPLGDAVARLALDQGLVLVVDQFEEVFGATREEAERGSFIDVLTRDRRGLRVVVTMRADHYGHCAAYPQLARLISATHVLVGPLTPPELASVIEAPAERVGLRVEPELVQVLIADAGASPPSCPSVDRAARAVASAPGWLVDARCLPCRGRPARRHRAAGGGRVRPLRSRTGGRRAFDVPAPGGSGGGGRCGASAGRAVGARCRRRSDRGPRPPSTDRRSSADDG